MYTSELKEFTGGLTLVKYKMFRFPIDAYDRWVGKRNKIQERIKNTTRKDVKVPLTDVLRFYGQQQRFEWDDNVLPYFTKKKTRARRATEGQVF